MILGKKNIFLILVCFFSANFVFSQEQIGLKMSNYGGVNSIGINPAWSANGPYKWDLNIVSLGAFFDNDYLFVQKGSLLKFLLKSNSIIPNPAIKKPKGNIEKPVFYNYEDRYKTYDLYQNLTILGPAFMYNFPNHSVGISYNIKEVFYLHEIAKDFGYYYFSDSATTKMVTGPLRTGVMTWGELGFNYAGVVMNNGLQELTVGLTAKYLMGFDAVVGKSNEESVIVKIDEGVKLASGNVDLNYATNYAYDYEAEDWKYKLKRNGNGFGLDFGIAYTNKLTTVDQPHKFKIGVSILDVGRIKYFKNATTTKYVRNDTVTFMNDDFKEVRDIDLFIDKVGQIAYGDSNALRTGTTFTSWLPTALSVQADFAVRENVYISAFGMMRMPRKGLGVDRENIIAVTPRYEKRKWEVGVPIVLYDFKRPRMGAYARLWNVTIGTDNFLSWFIPVPKWSGTDFYIGFKVNPKEEIDYLRSKKRGKAPKNFRCPKF